MTNDEQVKLIECIAALFLIIFIGGGILLFFAYLMLL